MKLNSLEMFFIIQIQSKEFGRGEKQIDMKRKGKRLHTRIQHCHGSTVLQTRNSDEPLLYSNSINHPMDLSPLSPSSFPEPTLHTHIFTLSVFFFLVSSKVEYLKAVLLVCVQSCLNHVNYKK